MRVIETEIEIDAPARTIWEILTDFSAMPSWNPFIRSISGPLAVGARLVVEIAPPGRSAMTFKPEVLTVSPQKELCWRGVVASQHVFAGEHRFQLEPALGGRTRLIHGEVFTGLLVPLVMRDEMLEATRAGFAAMNEALRLRAERANQQAVAKVS